MDTQAHVRRARYFLSAAEHPDVVANAQHRSEMLWGAATQMVKAAAKLRRLPNDSHRDLFRAVRRLGTDNAYTTLTREFGQAEKLHNNFYDGEMSDAEIVHSHSSVRAHSSVREFVAKMQRIVDAV